MLAKKNRLKSLFLKDFFKKSSSEDSLTFLLKYKNTTERPNDFGLSVVVSRKISSKAVERNSFKRKFLSTVLQHKDLLIQGFSYVFYLKPAIKNTPRDVVLHEMERILKKIHEKNN